MKQKTSKDDGCARVNLSQLRDLQNQVKQKPCKLKSLPVERRVQLYSLAKFDAYREDMLQNKLHCTGVTIEARGCNQDLTFVGGGGVGDTVSYPLLPELLRQINGNQSSFLVLGDSGSGKSVFAIRLCQEFWVNIHAWGRIPVYIFLPEYKSVKQILKRFFGKMLDDDNSLDQAKNLRYILVLDSFDELPDHEKEHNIATAQLSTEDDDGIERNFGWNGIASQFRDVKFVTLSRKQDLGPEKRKIIFDFCKHKNSLSEASEGHSVFYMAPFTTRSIKEYIQKFAAALKATPLNHKQNSVLQMVKKYADGRAWEEWKESDSVEGLDQNPNAFLRWFVVLPDLFQLASTPLILSLILAVMPEMLNPLGDSPKDPDPSHGGILSELQRLCRSRSGIYDLFTDNWFRFQSDRLEYSNSHPDLCSGVTREERILVFRLYSQNLAHWFLHAGSFKSTLPLPETENWTLLDAYNGNKLLKQACDRITDSCIVSERVRAENSAEILSTAHGIIALPASLQGILLPSADDQKCERNRKLKNLKAIRDGCLLQFSNNECQFVHRSLLVYFESRHLSETMELLFQLYLRNEMSAIDKQTSNLLLDNQLRNSEILSEFAARVNLRDRFDDVLLEVVRASRRLPALATFASNAITILNLGGRSLSGLDLQKVVIPHANLNHAILAKTDFRGADLEGVFLENAFFPHAQLQGANLRKAEFGQTLSLSTHEMPFGLTEEMEVCSYFSVPENKEYWLVSDIKGSDQEIEPWRVSKYELDWVPASSNFHFGHQGETETRKNLRTHVGSSHFIVTYETDKHTNLRLEGWSIEQSSAPQPLYYTEVEDVLYLNGVEEDFGYVALLEESSLRLWQHHDDGGPTPRTLRHLETMKISSLSVPNACGEPPIFKGGCLGSYGNFHFRCAEDKSACMAIFSSLNCSHPYDNVYVFAAVRFSLLSSNSSLGDSPLLSTMTHEILYSGISCIQICTMDCTFTLVAVGLEYPYGPYLAGPYLKLWRIGPDESATLKTKKQIMKIHHEVALHGHPERVTAVTCSRNHLLASTCNTMLILWQLDSTTSAESTAPKVTKLRVIHHNWSPVVLHQQPTIRNWSFGKKCIAFSQNSNYLAYLNRWGSRLKVWKLNCQTVARVTEEDMSNRTGWEENIEDIAFWTLSHPFLLAVMTTPMFANLRSQAKNRKLRVLELVSGKEVAQMQLGDHKYQTLRFIDRSTLHVSHTGKTQEDQSITYFEVLRLGLNGGVSNGKSSDDDLGFSNANETFDQLQLSTHDNREQKPSSLLPTDFPKSISEQGKFVAIVDVNCLCGCGFTSQVAIFAGEKIMRLVAVKQQQTILTISLWFHFNSTTFVPGTGDLDSSSLGYILLRGAEFETICPVEISFKGDCTKTTFLNSHEWTWKVLWFRSKCTDLIASSADTTNAHFDDKLSLDILRQEGAQGVDEVMADANWRFHSYASLFTEIPGTALGEIKCYEASLKVCNRPLLIDEHAWAVYAVAKFRDGFWGQVLGFVQQHVFLIVEGVLNNRRFLIYADYIIINGVPGVRVYPRCEAASAEERRMEFEKHCEELQSWQAQEFFVTTTEGLTLIDSIYEDREKRYRYGAMANETSEWMNCTKWTYAKLSGIGCNLSASRLNRFCYPPTQLVFKPQRNPFIRWTLLTRNLSPQQVWCGLAVFALIAVTVAVILFN